MKVANAASNSLSICGLRSLVLPKPTSRFRKRWKSNIFRFDILARYLHHSGWNGVLSHTSSTEERIDVNALKTGDQYCSVTWWRSLSSWNFMRFRRQSARSIPIIVWIGTYWSSNTMPKTFKWIWAPMINSQMLVLRAPILRDFRLTNGDSESVSKGGTAFQQSRKLSSDKVWEDCRRSRGWSGCVGFFARINV